MDTKKGFILLKYLPVYCCLSLSRKYKIYVVMYFPSVKHSVSYALEIFNLIVKLGAMHVNEYWSLKFKTVSVLCQRYINPFLTFLLLWNAQKEIIMFRIQRQETHFITAGTDNFC
jgi:hypothetical protein